MMRMRRILGKWSIVCGLVLACCALAFHSSVSAGHKALQGEVGPGTRKEVEQELRGFAKEISRKAPLNNETAFVLLTDYLRKNPLDYGAAFAFAPKKEGGKLIKSSPYVFRRGEELIKKDLMESYDYTASSQKWYVVPVKQKKAYWSEPYYDEGGGNAWMVTYSIPIYSAGKHRRLIGVVTSDVLISKQ